VLGENPLVAFAEIGLAEQAEQFVRAVAAEDVGRVQPVHLGNRLAQAMRGAIGIKREIVENA
jgi:hypothetical protein